MYSPPSSDKRQTIKQALIYTLMTMSVVCLVFVLILIMLGYRFDSTAGTIEQRGLVQLSSIPSGANLTIDAARLSATTSTKTTLAPGRHTVAMSRQGYRTWQKTVEVKSGSILWLNYARLIPNDLTPTPVASLVAVTSSMPSPDREWYAMTGEKNAPAVLLANINADNPVISTLVLPETLYKKAVNKDTESFVLSAWDSESRYVLLEHKYDDTVEWIVVDTDNITNSKNVTALFDIAMSKPQFSHTDSTVLFAIVNGDIRRFDLLAATISAPLVRNVAEFSFFDRTTLVYVTNVDPETKSRSVGYRQENAAEPRPIKTYSDEGTLPLHVSIGKYFNQTFVGIAYGSTVEISSGPLPRSDSEEPLSLTAVATMTAADPVTFFSNKTDGRFFVAQHGIRYSVYDLELQKATTTTIRGVIPADQELRWLDGYIVWSGSESMLRFYEFDGANQNDVMPIITGQRPALSPNNRYLYAPTQDEKGAFHLSRVRLVL